MKLDWKNIDWGALRASKVSMGSAVGILASIAALAGFTISGADQATIINDGMAVSSGVAAIGSLYSLWHRITAQPEGQTVIVPQKVQPPTT
jgi:hypothetical protein